MLHSFGTAPSVCTLDGVDTKRLSKLTYKWNKDKVFKVGKVCGITFGLIFAILNVQKCVLQLVVYE
jgi:hypothetical protein